MWPLSCSFFTLHIERTSIKEWFVKGTKTSYQPYQFFFSRPIIIMIFIKEHSFKG
uniref:Uncharacterized protein n=1 Tax=Tetranychus urticae TaxID=32264 RepID=T1L425_TETUR